MDRTDHNVSSALHHIHKWSESNRQIEFSASAANTISPPCSRGAAGSAFRCLVSQITTGLTGIWSRRQ